MNKEEKEIENKKKQVEQYIKDNFWKTFWKYKLIEITSVIVGGLAIWKIPYWFGKLLFKIFNINLSGSKICSDSFTITESCSSADVWSMGFIAICIIGGIIWANYLIVKSNLKEKARKKFKLRLSDL